MGNDDFDKLWTRLKNDLAFRIGTVYAGASWFIVEAADTLGASGALVRWMAVALGAGFLVVVPAAWLADRRSARLQKAELADGHWGIGSVSSRARRSRAGTKRWATAVAVLVILAAGLWFGGTRVYGGAVPEAATRIAVVPFHATGSEAAREFGVGIVDLISASLDHVGDIRTVSARTVLARSGTEPGVSPTIEEALEIGRDVGAGSVLTGSITSVGGRAVRITAELRAVADSTVLAGAAAEGAEDEILTLTDELAVRLLRDMWRSADPLPTVSTAALLTSSPSALRQHLRGERFLRRMEFDSATAAFRAATGADSTFALAWFRLAESTGWGLQEALPDRRTYTANAARHAGNLPARERALVAAMQVRLRGDFDAADTIDAYVRRYSDDPYGWYLLGDTRFHAMRLGLYSDREVTDPFLEAARLDPGFALGFRHAIDYATDSGDRETFDRLMEHYQTVAQDADVEYLRSLARVRWAPADSLVAHFVDEIRPLHSVEDRYMLNGLVGVLGKRVRLDPVVDPMHFTAALDSSRALFAGDRAWTLSSLNLTVQHLLSVGRADRAFEMLDLLLQTGAVGGPAPPHLRRPLMRTVLSITADVPADQVRADVARIEASLDELPFAESVLRVFYTKAGEPSKAERFALDYAQTPDMAAVDTAGVRLAFTGWVAALAGDDERALGQLDEGYRRLGTQDAFGFEPGFIVHAELVSRVPERRQQGIRMLRYITTYRAADTGRAYLALGLALEAAGDAVGAREAYGHVIRLWEGADNYRQDEVQAARGGLERLARDVG